MNSYQLSETLELLCQGKHLNQEQSYDHFSTLIEGKLSQIEMTAFLVALKAKGETLEEALGALLAMQKYMIIPQANELKQKYTIVDCAGTGGDKQQTLNISTASAIILSCTGIKVAKSGNRAISSKSGTADIFEKVGVNIDISPTKALNILEQIGLCFLFAPNYNPAAKIISQIRSSLKVRTIFNFIGPVSNPVQPENQLIGVYDPRLTLPYVNLLKSLGLKNALVVHGSGLDEIAVHGLTQGYLLKNGAISPFSLDPTQLGIKTYSLEDIKGQDIAYNANELIKLLSGKGNSAYRASVALNAGTILWLTDFAHSISEGFEMIQALLDTNQGMQQLTSFIEASHAK